MTYEGPYLYENWKEAIGGKPITETVEFPIYGDAHLTSHLEFEKKGPYLGFNTLGLKQSGILAPTLIFRADVHLLDVDRTAEIVTNVDLYHGGLIEDEFASLLSLTLGARFQAGSMNRWFKPDEDPKGQPMTLGFRRIPVLPYVTKQERRLPSFIETKSLLLAEAPIMNLPKLEIGQATVLIKTARQYQTGVWIADDQPELCWLFLVSAIETAANFWRRKNDPAEVRFSIEHEEVAKMLTEAGGDELLRNVALKLETYLGATKKFIDFLSVFLPLPPDERPNLYKIVWEDAEMREAFKTIYKWRSRALHGGTPFPGPMCEPPRKFEDGYPERPMGLAAKQYGGSWTKADLPMLLHTFEYIVRGALLKWWESMVVENIRQDHVKSAESE